MRFLLDMNVPPTVAARLRAEGHDAIHAVEAGLSDLSDHEIFARASGDARIVVTFDLDFGEIAGAIGAGTAGVVLLRLKLARQSHLWNRLSIAITEAGDALEAGAIVLVEDARMRVRRRGIEE
jgi:predicted nuclease of predicted toxin-antitoxin system